MQERCGQVQAALHAAREGLDLVRAALEAIRALPGDDAHELTAPEPSLTPADLATAPELLGRLASLAPPLAHFATERPSLEGIFLALTGRSLRDAGGPT
jgi:hypothetical protein